MIPRLYAIADAETLARRNIKIGDFARELREAGVRLVQYRDKVGAPQEILRACAEIASVFAGVDATLILNDRADLAVLAGWGGVHVGQGDLTVEAVRQVMGGREIQGSHRSALRTPVEMTEFRRLVGVSTHNEEQVRMADASGPDYVAVGPVFATSSKANPEPVVGLEGVRRARALTTKPLVAIGGITRENARSVIEAGADAVAVIGGLFGEGRRVGDVVRDFLEVLG